MVQWIRRGVSRARYYLRKIWVGARRQILLISIRCWRVWKRTVTEKTDCLEEDIQRLEDKKSTLKKRVRYKQERLDQLSGALRQTQTKIKEWHDELAD